MSRPRRVEGNVYRRSDTPTLWCWYWDAAGVKRRQACTSSDEAEARAELEAILARVRRGEEAVPESGELTLAAWSERWIRGRREAGKGEAENEEGHLVHHVLPDLGRVRLRELAAAQVLDFIRRLPAHKAATGSGERLSPTTVHKVAATLRLCLREAAKRGLIQASPCNWDASDLPERGAPDVGEGFSEAEVAALLDDERIPQDRRVLYALEFLTGMRTGEAAARRWRDWDERQKPLGALRIESAWSTKRKAEKETKTRVRRTVPVHPVLAEMLSGWRGSGWEAFQGRPPASDDLIVPAQGGGPRPNNLSWEAFQADLELLGLRAQRHYETRSTFLTLCEAGGADPTLVRVLTHPSPRAAADLYRRTKLMWPRLCQTVQSIHLKAA